MIIKAEKGQNIEKVLNAAEKVLEFHIWGYSKIPHEAIRTIYQSAF